VILVTALAVQTRWTAGSAFAVGAALFAVTEDIIVAVVVAIIAFGATNLDAGDGNQGFIDQVHGIWLVRNLESKFASGCVFTGLAAVAACARQAQNHSETKRKLMQRFRDHRLLFSFPDGSSNGPQAIHVARVFGRRRYSFEG